MRHAGLRPNEIGFPLPYAMLAFLSLLWGSSFLFVKIAARALDPFSLAFGRVAIGAAALLASVALSDARWPRGGKLWVRLAALALIGQVAPFLLLAAAARLTTSADLALMMGGAPIFTFAVAWASGQEQGFTARKGLGLALGLAGVAVSIGISGGAGAGQNPSAGWGRGLALLAALGYATGATLSREASREVGPSLAATASMLFSTLALAVLWLAVDGVHAGAAFTEAPAGPLAAMAALGVFNTALAYFVYFRLVMTAGATFAALNNYVVPFLGMIAGAALLGDPIAPSAWVGFALVIAGVALTGAAPRAP
jgi:drug/metabolite transporter (DMT)-like permease